MSLTAAQLLTLGRDCGLNYPHEAYNMAMSHYDAFFKISNLQEEEAQLHLDMLNTGLLVKSEDPGAKYRWPDKEETIEEAMTRLNIEYHDIYSEREGNE